MSVRNVLLSTAGVAVITALGAVIFDWSFERALILAPIAVLVFGASAGLVVLWTRAALDGIRGRERS